MSLVGSLEDLGLGDILQIVSLSRKSGLLLLRSEEGDGRIVFCDGLVRAAFVKGEAEDLRTLLVSGEFIDADAFDRAAETAAAHDDPIADVLATTAGFPRERLDSLRREQVERSVFRMFSWKSGEFSFEIRDEIDPRDREMMLATGINAQFLTMEATRLGDEGARKGRDLEADGDIEFGTVDGPLARPEGEDAALEGEADGDAAAEHLALATAERVDALDADAPHAADDPHDTFDPSAADAPHDAFDPSDAVDAVEPEAAPESEPAWECERADSAEPEPQPPSDSEPSVDSGAGPIAETTPASPPELEKPPPDAREPDPKPESVSAHDPESVPEREPEPVAADPAVASAASRSLVIIDPHLGALEWQKSVLGPICKRIHIFQRAENGITRIRQYLRRGEEPLVLVSSDVPADPHLGIEGASDLIRRLRAHAPRMHVWLLETGSGEVAAPPGVETLMRPANHELSSRRGWERLEEAGARLRETIAGRPCEVAAAPPDSAAVASPSERFSAARLARLKAMSDRLRDPSVRGEVLSLILEFAAESFARVAIFMVRDDEAVGMAQSGLGRAGGPDDPAFREVVIPAQAPAWFRAVLESREGHKAPPSDAGDRELAARLGDRAPSEAYVAPIESSHRVVALVYVDNLPGDEPIGETASLEIFLHEAGLALERALLERALADASERGGV